jgi:hypothetical protein
MNCNDIRELLALDPTSEDTLIHEHLGQCEGCAGYRRQHQALDMVLRAEMRWEPPAALTAQLLSLVAMPAETLAAMSPLTQPVLQAPVPRVRPRPKAWYIAAVYALTIGVIALSLLVAIQLVGALTEQVSIGAALTQLLALPAQGLSYLTHTLPQSRYLIDFFLKVRDQLMWLLLVAVLWAVLDKWNIPLDFGRRRQTS